MKISIFVLIINILPLYSFCQKIEFNDTLDFNWHLFKREYSDTTDVAAGIMCGVYIETVEEKLDYMIIKVIAYMKPELSWVKPGLMTNDLLQHEYGHFLIMEILVRKLREILTKTKLSYYNEIMITQQLLKDCMSNYRKLSKIYDEETDYHNNKKMQEKWLILLKNELIKTERYKNSEFKVSMCKYGPNIKVEYPDYDTFFNLN